jgi:hypothetical protein
MAGEGWRVKGYLNALKRRLRRRRLTVPLLEHDLVAEMHPEHVSRPQRHAAV